MEPQWIDKIFAVHNRDFGPLAMEIFQFQYANNPVYQDYCKALDRDPEKVLQIKDLPFLPVRFFRDHFIQTTQFEPTLIFESSGTGASIPGRHLVKDAAIYGKSFTRCFEKFYGPATGYCVLGLLPSYLERGNSSLVYMTDQLIRQSGHTQSGFYLNDYEALLEILGELRSANQKTLLIGVTFALLDLAEIMLNSKTRRHFSKLLVMETGGMKGRREEMIRPELHAILKKAFGVSSIHSEYGMTELLSQAYAAIDGKFETPAWMKICLRDEEDPLLLKDQPVDKPVTGLINIIDLANVYSCSFLATDDIGQTHPDGRFEVLGRVDGSDLRGCSLMAV